MSLKRTLRGAAALAVFAWACSPAPARAKDRPRPKLAPAEEGSEPGQPDATLIDEPTASALDYGALSVRSRFNANGGNQDYLSVGVLERFNLGASVTLDHFIGTQNPIHARAPALQARWRFFDGTAVFPALALGFDGQGYFYNDLSRKYNERQRGLYLVGSRELLLPGLWLHPGVNIEDFDTSAFYAFVGLSYALADKASLMAEWDNIRNARDSRFNLGARLYVAPSVQLDLALREIGGHSAFPDGVSHGAERVVQALYMGSF